MRFMYMHTRAFMSIYMHVCLNKFDFFRELRDVSEKF